MAFKGGGDTPSAGIANQIMATATQMVGFEKDEGEARHSFATFAYVT